MKVEIVMGMKCNNNCLFCSIAGKDWQKPLDVILSEIDSLDLGSIDEINFTGGEPTLHPNIIDAISYVKGRVKNIRITTNGRTLSIKSFAERLFDAGLTGAIFSVHSHDRSVHDYLSQANGAFDQLMEGIGNARLFTDDIAINTVVNSLNYRHLPDIVDFLASDVNPRSICFIYPTFYGNLRKNMYLVPRYSDVSPYVEKAIEKADHYGIHSWILNFPACFVRKFPLRSSLMSYNTKMVWKDSKTDLDKKKFEGSMKFPECEKCVYKNRCPGIPEEYVKLFPNERPVPMLHEKATY